MNKLSFVALFVAISVTGVNAHPGTGILENSKGEIYYTDLKQVLKITVTGQVVVVVPRVHTHELFLDKEDNLFGEHLWYNGEQKDTWGHYVWKLSSDGKISKVIPDQDGFLTDYSFVRDHTGRMYWADRSSNCQKVVRRNADNSQTTLTTPCFHNIRKLEALRDGSLAVLDFQDIKKVTPEGRVTTVAAKIANKNWTTSSRDNQNSIMSIWEDAEANLYAAVLSERLVKKFRPDRTEEIALKTSFPWMPSGGLVDSRGQLWVLECNLLNSVRVERRDKDGKLTSFEL